MSGAGLLVISAEASALLAETDALHMWEPTNAAPRLSGFPRAENSTSGA